MGTLNQGKMAGLSNKKPSTKAKPSQKPPKQKAEQKTPETEAPLVGYTIGNQTANHKLKRTHVFLTPDIVSFVDDFSYSMKKEKGIRVTTSELTRIGLRLFKELPKEEQIKLLMD